MGMHRGTWLRTSCRPETCRASPARFFWDKKACCNSSWKRWTLTTPIGQLQSRRLLVLNMFISQVKSCQRICHSEPKLSKLKSQSLFFYNQAIRTVTANHLEFRKCLWQHFFGEQIIHFKKMVSGQSSLPSARHTSLRAAGGDLTWRAGWPPSAQAMWELIEVTWILSWWRYGDVSKWGVRFSP